MDKISKLFDRKINKEDYFVMTHILIIIDTELYDSWGLICQTNITL